MPLSLFNMLGPEEHRALDLTFSWLTMVQEFNIGFLSIYLDGLVFILKLSHHIFKLQLYFNTKQNSSSKHKHVILWTRSWWNHATNWLAFFKSHRLRTFLGRLFMEYSKGKRSIMNIVFSITEDSKHEWIIYTDGKKKEKLHYNNHLVAFLIEVHQAVYSPLCWD